MYNISLMCKPDVMQKGLDNVNDDGAGGPGGLQCSPQQCTPGHLSFYHNTSDEVSKFFSEVVSRLGLVIFGSTVA